MRLLVLCLSLTASACGTCSTADLSAKYAADLALWCDPDKPLAECPAHPELAAEYERRVAARKTGAEPCPH